jgi:hypothetical protein
VNLLLINHTTSVSYYNVLIPVFISAIRIIRNRCSSKNMLSQLVNYMYIFLLPCKIWGFCGDDYEEFRLLGYKNPVRTSQETHYVSTTELSRLMLHKIWDFHGGNYE